MIGLSEPSGNRQEVSRQTDVEGSVLDDVQKEELKAVIWPLVDAWTGIFAAGACREPA